MPLAITHATIHNEYDTFIADMQIRYNKCREKTKYLDIV
jgi:hypothetical protein